MHSECIRIGYDIRPDSPDTRRPQVDVYGR